LTFSEDHILAATGCCQLKFLHALENDVEFIEILTSAETLLKHLAKINVFLMTAGKPEAEGWSERCNVLSDNSVPGHDSMSLQHLPVALG